MSRARLWSSSGPVSACFLGPGGSGSPSFASPSGRAGKETHREQRIYVK